MVIELASDGRDDKGICPYLSRAKGTHHVLGSMIAIEGAERKGLFREERKSEEARSNGRLAPVSNCLKDHRSAFTYDPKVPVGPLTCKFRFQKHAPVPVQFRNRNRPLSYPRNRLNWKVITCRFAT